MTFIIVSGVLISKVLFPSFSIGDQRWFHEIHILGSYLTLILMGVHLGLHWRWIKGQIKKVFQAKPYQIALVLTKLSLILLLIFGGYSLLAPQLEANLPEFRPDFVSSQKKYLQTELSGLKVDLKTMNMMKMN